MRPLSPRLPRPLLLLPLFVGLGLPTAAAADPGASGERPLTWDMSQSELQELGLGQYRGDAIPVPADAPKLHVDNAPAHGGSQGRIFVNFDGAQLSSGYDDSTNDVTQIGQLAGSFAAYGEGSKRDAVMQAVRTDWADFNVVVVDERPASGDYTMNMTGPTNPFGGGVLGIAPLDCNDSQTHNNITYAFHSANDGFSAAVTATTVGQEVAHSYGLEHVDEPGDVMNPYNAGGDASFIDQCIQVVQGANCGAQHSAECGSSTSQNSYQELMTLFGPSTPDTADPTVTIVSPNDGQEFEIGSDFAIDVEADDDTGIQQVALFNNGTEIETDGSEPFGWEVTNVPEGEYEFYVEATDIAGNTSQSNIVTVVVTENPTNGDDDDDDDSSGDDDDDDSSGDDDDDDSSGDDDDDDDDDEFMGEDGDLPPGFGLDGDDAEGCACRTTGVGGSGPAPLWLGLVGLLGLARRRRAR